MKITPASLDAVLEVLEVKFPDKLPNKVIPEHEIYMLVGNQQVVKYLKELRESL